MIVAIVGGIGGGLLFADIVSPKAPKQEMTRLEQRMSAQPIQVIAGTSEPAPNPVAPPSPTLAAAPTVPAPAQPQAPIAQAAPAATIAAAPAAVPVAPTEVPPAQPAAQKQPTAGSPEDAIARARDVDVKRAATEKRRAERRQQWSEKRRPQQRQERELREFEDKVREETEGRPILAFERAHNEPSRVRLFDLE